MGTRQLYLALFEMNRRLVELTISIQDVLTILQGDVLTEESPPENLEQEGSGGKPSSQETTDEQNFVDEREVITISLLNRQGQVPKSSRLNMGHSHTITTIRRLFSLNRRTGHSFQSPKKHLTLLRMMAKP